MLRKIVLLAAALLLPAGAASAKTLPWALGWDGSGEPLDLAVAHSNVKWSLNKLKKTLTVTFTLTGAKPGKVYQVGGEFFNLCPSAPASFGQFPAGGDFSCSTYTRQGVTKSTVHSEFGVVTTDAAGFGKTVIAIGPLASGTYQLEFIARNGAGCQVSGGGSNFSVCTVVFQSPGPTFGTTATIVVP